jgi:hypothetical protein
LDAGLDSGSGSGSGDASVDAEGGETGATDAATDASDAADAGLAGSSSCEHPQSVTFKDWVVDLPANTGGAPWVMNAPCSVRAPDAGDGGLDAGQVNNGAAFYGFAFADPVFFYADTFGASWDTVLFLLSASCKPLGSTTPGDAVCNDDACGTQQSQVVALLQPGDYVLGVTGYGTGDGLAVVHARFTLAASGTEHPLPQGTSTQTGATGGEPGNIGDESTTCIAAGPENGYWWVTCPDDPGGTLTASTCDGGADWETIVELEMPGSNSYVCALDDCPAPYGMQSSLSATIPPGAGLRLLAIDGEGGNSLGEYSMTVTRP